MKSTLIFFLILGLYPSLQLFAQEKQSNPEEEKIKDLTEFIVSPEEKIESQHIQKEEIKNINAAKGIIEKIYLPSNDTSRFGLGFLANLRPDQFFRVKTYEFQYSKRDKEYELWWVFNASLLNTEFSQISQNIVATDSNSHSQEAESENIRPDQAKQTLFLIGFGVLFRDQFPLNLNFSKDLLHEVSTIINYVSLKDDFRQKNYNGPGLKVDYGLHKRISPFYHLGIRLSYHLASVTRKELYHQEPSSDRRLILTWASMGLELTFYL